MKRTKYLAVVKHAAWTAAHKAGHLRSGRYKVGQVVARKSKAAHRAAQCRGRYRGDDVG
jgi:hypothetical protein